VDGEEELVQVHPRLPGWLARRIDAYAERRGLSQSQAIKVLLVSAVDALGEEDRPRKLADGTGFR
jgi:hypothetical protein